MYLLAQFPNLSDLVNTNFLTLIHDIVVGVIINDECNSKYKYEFIQNSIEYMLEQSKSLNDSILPKVIQIFNLIWSVFPVLDAEWSKELIMKKSKNKDYHKSMKNLTNKQEFQFYKLYEKMHGYAMEYFELLKAAMNCDLEISNDIIKGFKYVLNAMKPGVFEPLIKNLIETSSQEHSKLELGRITNNIASRSPE